MGLAASQARLLTVTSRLSDIEYKQQQISNMKMRMSVENEQIANDYSEALNNQTLELNDGTGQVAFTYDNLVNAGYGVMKTSDGSLATSTTTSTTTGGTTTSQTVTPISDDVLKWVGKSEPVLGQGDYVLASVTTPTATAPVKPTTISMDSITGLSTAQQYAQTLQNGGDYGAAYTARGNIGSQLTSAMNKLSSYNSASGISAFSQATGYLRQAQNNVSKLTVSSKGGNLYYSPEYTGVTPYVTQAMSSAGSAISQYNAQVNDPSSSMMQRYNSQLTAYNNANSTYATNLAKNNATQAQFNIDHTNWAAAQALTSAQIQYGNYEGVDATPVTTPTTTTTNTTYNDLAQQCRNNPQFLIQGLLSGYLTLTDADGNPTSLDSNTAISTVYDKSDDAKAEAEYESRMSKLNRKEKQLDNQMSELDTEYSALTTEYESIKSIISTHSQKDFELFS